jgi:hypothetical protein
VGEIGIGERERTLRPRAAARGNAQRAISEGSRHSEIDTRFHYVELENSDSGVR